MKKSKLLILLTASSVAAVTAVVLAPKAKGSKLSATECDHNGYHYNYIAATPTSPGRMEYWKCCICNEVFLEKPEGVFQEGKSEFFFEMDALIPAHTHSDGDSDGHCDYFGCLEEVDCVIGSIIRPSRTIGRGETMHLSSDVKAYGKATSDVYYVVTDINGLASRVTLTDHEDGTADIESSENTGNSVFKGTVSLYAAYDDSLLDSFELATSTYGSTNRTPIKNFFSTTDYHIIPFSYQSSFVNSGTSMKQTISNRDTYKEVVGEYLNQGTWTLVSESDEKTVFTLQDSKDAGVYYKAEITPTSGGAVVNFTLNEHVFTSFPSELVNGILSGKTTSTVIAPETATNYTFTKTSSALTGFTLYVNGGDMNEYLSQLEAEDYYLIKASNTEYNCVSPDRTLVVSVSLESGFFTMSFKVQTAPKGSTEWKQTDKDLMVSYLGEVLPFVDADIASWYDYSLDYNYISANSYRKEFFPLVLDAFEKDNSFTKDSQTDYKVVFLKNISDKKQIKVTVDSDGMYKAELIVKPETTWLTDKIAEALGSYAEEALPAAAGTSYTYTFDATNHKVTVVVTGDMDAYYGVLEAASFDMSGYDPYFAESSTGTLSVTVTGGGYPYDTFTIVATAHLPEGTTETFPADAVKGALGVSSVPSVEGSLFVFEKGEGYTCSVEVTGNKVAFLSSLTDFSEDSGVYSNESMNVKLSVEDIDDGIFKISFSRVKEPELGAWPSEQIKASMEALSMTTTSIPAPSVFTSAEFKSNQSQKIGYYTYYYDAVEIKGADVDSYLSVLSNAGFDLWDAYPASNMTDVYDNGCEFYVDYRSSDVIIIMIVSDYDY